MLLLPGDLAYADRVQNLWDSFGHLVDPLASQRPWIVTQGNHEVEKTPVADRSYTDFDNESKQYKWLQGDLKKGDKESVNMKASMKDLLYKARVDVIFEGHVHAYERFTWVYKNKGDKCGPIYINIGDGGNREGLATKYKNPNQIFHYSGRLTLDMGHWRCLMQHMHFGIGIRMIIMKQLLMTQFG
ncbi:hypothetical protein TanjilG_27663 [Lupinus angustifolius]|uniref:acid phosphatase n=1 Tax=Lupinus angustifolius TaxID=3871 RepID=A0A1J7GJH1_LUPAN|nr:hypothetical protein TanjilG_27663 [Lupinus angustifolius]